MASIFSRIISGEIPSYKIAENENCFAFLDINPLAIGHTLIVPKKEIDYYFDLDDVTISEMNNFAKRIAIAMKSVIPCERIGMTVIGLEVPHAHIHLIPINNISDMDFKKAKLKMSTEEFQNIAKNISEAFK